MEQGQTIIDEIFATDGLSREQTKENERRVNLIIAYNMGELTFAQFQTLSATERRAYRRRFGAPMSPCDVRAEQKKREKRIATAKAAKAARKRQRRA